MKVGNKPMRVVGWVMPTRGAMGELLRAIADETDAIEEEWDAATPEASGTSADGPEA
jgi:hypothetical protein